MTNIQFIAKSVQTAAINIQNTVQLLQEDCTIPFISRYRKDKTGNLDEVFIEQIAKFQKEYEVIVKRKEAILKSIQEQNALSPELEKKIQQSFDLQELEDFYLPFKKKKKTKADTARENGLEPLAKIIMAQNNDDIDFISTKYLNENIINEDAALQGARDIIAEWINENIYVRKQLRRLYERKATITTKVVKTKKDDEAAQKFSQYFDWSEPLSKAPSHRLLAMLRAENEGFIKFKVEVDIDEAYDIIDALVLKSQNKTTPHVQLAIEDSYKRLLNPAISNEALQEAKAKADANSIQVFANNLGQLLLAPPLGEKRILAIDPGFRSGCKIVCLDEKGDLLYNETIYPHAPQKEEAMAMKKIRSMVNSYKIDAISIGNGTASRETEFFIKKIAFDKPVQVFIVSEAGASVYSASKIARDEFPNYDVTVRGSVSIGRRLSDPLAELVKIDPKAIGVGQYQHDVDQTKLKEELDLYEEGLSDRACMILANKMDNAASEENLERLRKETDLTIFPVIAELREGVDEVLEFLHKRVMELKKSDVKHVPKLKNIYRKEGAVVVDLEADGDDFSLSSDDDFDFDVEDLDYDDFYDDIDEEEV